MKILKDFNESLKANAHWFDIIQAVAVVAAVISLFLNQYIFESDHDRTRRMVALSLWDSWADIVDNSPTMRFTMNMFREEDTVDWEAVVHAKGNLVTAQSETDSLKLIYQKDCYTLLNFYEKVACVYLKGMGDEEVIEEGFKSTIRYDYFRLKKFREAYGIKKGARPWPLLTVLVEDNWPKKPDKRPPLGE